MTSKVDMVSVVIPTLNEAGNIKEALTIIDSELAFPKEIIVVDGNSAKYLDASARRRIQHRLRLDRPNDFRPVDGRVRRIH